VEQKGIWHLALHVDMNNHGIGWYAGIPSVFLAVLKGEDKRESQDPYRERFISERMAHSPQCETGSPVSRPVLPYPVTRHPSHMQEIWAVEAGGGGRVVERVELVSFQGTHEVPLVAVLAGVIERVRHAQTVTYFVCRKCREH